MTSKGSQTTTDNFGVAFCFPNLFFGFCCPWPNVFPSSSKTCPDQMSIFSSLRREHLLSPLSLKMNLATTMWLWRRRIAKRIRKQRTIARAFLKRQWGATRSALETWTSAWRRACLSWQFSSWLTPIAWRSATSGVRPEFLTRFQCYLQCLLPLPYTYYTFCNDDCYQQWPQWDGEKL